MEKQFDLQVVDTKEKLINLINESGLPITVLQYLIADIKNIVDVEAQKALIKQREDYSTNKEMELK